MLLIAIISGLISSFGLRLEVISYFSVILLMFNLADFIKKDRLKNKDIHFVEKATYIYLLIQEITQSISIFVFTYTISLTTCLSLLNNDVIT